MWGGDEPPTNAPSPERGGPAREACWGGVSLTKRSHAMTPTRRPAAVNLPLSGGGTGKLPDFVAPKVAAEIKSWLSHLGAERRMSPKTVEAYRRDVQQFLAFLAEHLGGAPSLQELARLSPADVRAFLAARRANNIGSRSLMWALAGMRAFGRFLERNGKGKVGALTAVRAPKIGKTLPRDRK